MAREWSADFGQPGRIGRCLRLLCLVALGCQAARVHAQPDQPSTDRAQPPSPDAETEQPSPEPPTEEEAAELKTLDATELPSFQRLMQGPAVDWILLTTGKVLEVEPLNPRPGTIDDLKGQIAKLMRKAGQPAETEVAKRKRLSLYNLPVTLVEGEEREYRLHINFIKDITYYEDLMLRRVDQLLDDRDVRRAYELLTTLDQRQENWPGVVPRRDRLAFTESLVKLAAGQPEEALALLESLHERNAAYAGLVEQFGIVVDQLMRDALSRDDSRQARFFLKRLLRRLPSHKTAAAWTGKLMQATRELLSQSAAAERAGQNEAALDFVEQAARTWPELPEVLSVYNRLANRHQRLRVGVVDLPNAVTDPNSAVLARAELRRRQLTETPLFRASRFDDKIARYESRFFQDWTPTELGHRVVFRLRPTGGSAQSMPPLTAAGLSEALAERLDSAGDRYDARFAAIVTGLAVRGPFDLTVQFDQPPLRPEALFAFPFRRAAAFGASASTSTGGDTTDENGTANSYPFRMEPYAGDGRARYRRSIAEPERTADRHVSEIVEIRYASHDKAIQGLLRGEVSLLPSVPPGTVKSFSGRNEFFTQQYGLPVTHLLQFHPRQTPGRSRALRRALIYALDRPQLLTEVFLRGSTDNLGRLTTAPWPTTLYGYNRFIKPHPFDPALAYSLARNAEKELGHQIAPLRIWVADAPEVREAAGRIVGAWQKIGVPAALIAGEAGSKMPSLADDDWDVAYRAEVMAEPLIELWPFLALTASTQTQALSYLPAWLRHDLLDLDRVGDWRTAEQLLNKLHRQFWAEVHLIPLWEIDEHFVARKNIRNIPDRPLWPYQAIERWKVEPWFSRD
ncbi:MAG: hypothetical protein EXS05_07545 [Planctomycetaceae bacterium]|nr:hypothetical protein [Planctomycetaceae bacterium]